MLNLQVYCHSNHLKIICVMGARPNFMKVAALYRAFSKHPGFSVKLLHTGQHHDDAMYGVFLTQLGLPHPDFALGIHGGSHTEQTARIMLAFEKIVKTERPDAVLVVGDVNSSLACALVAAKEGVLLFHVEAGLRSGDRTMPEEINRLLIDRISDELFVSEAGAMANLLDEHIAPERMHFVGNVMIDTLAACRENALNRNVFEQLGLVNKGYVLMTMHRPANVDTPEALAAVVELIGAVGKMRKVVFPLHPRTKASLVRNGMFEEFEKASGLVLLPPQGYFEFINLMAHSAMVITDSGGIQEETTFLGIPCVTLRNNTERPATIGEGTNYLAGDLAVDKTIALVERILSGNVKKHALPVLWDGRASARIVEIIERKYLVKI